MKTLALFTSLTLAHIKPAEKEFTLYDAGCDGLALRVYPTGSRVWVTWIKIGSTTRRRTLGHYPEMSLNDARRAFHTTRSENKLPESRMVTGITFTTLTARFMAAKRETYRPSTLSAFGYYLRNQLLPAFGYKPIGQIAPQDVAHWFHDYSQQRPGGANQALSHFTTILNWGKANGILPHDLPNPAAPIRKNRRPARGRMLSSAQLAALGWELNAATGLQRSAAHAIRLILLTGCRSGEILRLTWAEVKQDRLALSRTKTGPREVYLNETAQKLLTQLRTEATTRFVFPGRGSISEPIGSIVSAWHTIRTRAGLSDDVRLHDLRHTYASHAILAGESLPITGRLIGHRSPRSTARYAHLDPGAVLATAEDVAGEIDHLLRQEDISRSKSQRQCGLVDEQSAVC